jgi:hypothetical protein
LRSCRARRNANRGDQCCILAVLVVALAVAALSLFGPGAGRGPVALVGPATASATGDIPPSWQQWIECAGWDGCGGSGGGGGGGAKFYAL